MSTQVQIRRGNTAQTSTFTGSIAEITVDTDKKVVVVHDGTTAGGNPLIRANASITTGQILTSNGSHLLALSNTGTAGVYGNASFIPVVTTDAYGRVSSVTNTAIAISSGVVTGVMTFAQGGANATSYTTGGLLTSNGTAFVSVANTGTAGTYANAAYVPVITTDAYGRVSAVTNTLVQIAASQITSGVLPFSQGGANNTTYTTGAILTSNGTAFVALSNTGTAGTYANAAYVPVITTDAYGRVSAVTNTAIAIDTAAITSGTLADARLPATGTAGTYANSTHIPVITTDAKGRVTAITNTVIQSSTTSVQGIVQLNDTVTSTLTSVAATANAVNATYNFAATKFNSSGGSITGTVSVTGNVYADNVIANSAFTSLGGTSRLQLTDIGLVSIQVAGVETKFGASGIENSPGIYGGSFGGNKLSLNSETNLISNRGDVVKIQTGTTGTAVNDFVFSNTSLTVPGGITANGFTAGGINVVPTLASSFSTANAAFTRANNSLNVNTGGSITGDVTVTGNLTIVGQTIYANTTTALIADNILTLNAAIGQASAPTVNAGIEVDRGSSANVLLLWNETSDKWTFTNDGSTYYDIADAGRLDSVFSLANGTAGVANTDYTTISAAAGVYGNASHVTVTTLTANGRVSSITNTAIAIDTAAITSGTIADARLPTKGTAGTYANASHVPVITTDAYGRVTSITNTAIAISATSITGIQTFAQGGTNAASYTTGSLLTSNGTAFVSVSNTGTAGTYANAAYVPVITTDAYGRVSSVTNTAIAIDTSALASGTVADARLPTKGTAGTYANAAYVPVITTDSYGRITGVTNTAIAIDTAAITSGTLADARLPTKGTAGTYANSTYVPVITTDAYGRVTAITNTAISFPSDTDTLQTVTTRGSTTANAINVTNTTSSTSKTTGALVVAGGVGVAGDLFAGNSIVVDGGTYGNVTTTQFASVYGQAYGPNPYSIMQVRSSDFKTGMGIQVYSGLNGLLYSNTGIQFNTSVIARDKDFPTGGTNAGQFAANGAFIAQASLASTSNATGSIQVVGGVGVKGNVSADGIIFPDNTRQTTAATGGATLGDVLALSIALG
jgi:hypothetical protein